MLFYWDARVLGRERYVLSESMPMRVPDEVKDCVVFVGYRGADDAVHLGGTAFSVTIPLGILEYHTKYIVTARHVIEFVRVHSTDRHVHLRLNTPSDGPRWVQLPLDGWTCHASEDIAIFPWAPDDEIFDYYSIHIESFMSEETVKGWGIGIGDEVFFPGLFVNHYGASRNIPIVRTGTIAAMPGELINTGMGPMKAMLVEARSIGGLSGSPVFVNAGGVREDPQTSKYKMMARSQFVFGGLMHGHWNVHRVDAVTSLDDEVVNMGVGIVVPSWTIKEMLESPEFEMDRQKMKQLVARDKMPAMDVAVDAPTESANTRSAFIGDLTKVTRLVEPSDQGSSGTSA